MQPKSIQGLGEDFLDVKFAWSCHKKNLAIRNRSVNNVIDRA